MTRPITCAHCEYSPGTEPEHPGALRMMACAACGLPECEACHESTTPTDCGHFTHDAVGRPAVLVTDSWAGRVRTRVRVVEERAHRVHVTPARGVERVKLAGRNRWLAAGEFTWVPRHAITYTDTPAEATTP
jgi:hypothetical protein